MKEDRVSSRASELEGKDRDPPNQWTSALRIRIRSSPSNIVNKLGRISLSLRAELMNSRE